MEIETESPGKWSGSGIKSEVESRMESACKVA